MSSNFNFTPGLTIIKERHVSHVIADMKILFEQNKPAKFKAAVQFNIPMYKEQYIYDSIKEGKAGEQKVRVVHIRIFRN